jgi:hypothetical protein
VLRVLGRPPLFPYISVDRKTQAKQVHDKNEHYQAQNDVMLLDHGTHCPLIAAASHAAPQAVAATEPNKATWLAGDDPDIRIARPEITPATVPRAAAIIFHILAVT